MNTRVREGRTALVVTVLLIVTLTIPVVLWEGSSSFAQQGSQPSPSGTGPAIQLLNPSDYSTPTMVSDKDTNDTDSDLEYHFTAVVTNTPPNPLVEFFIIQGNDVSFLGNGTFRDNGAVDVVAPIPDDLDEGIATGSQEERGEATVRAILYANNGLTEVARDNQDVVVNQRDRGQDEGPFPGTNAETDPSRTAETAEITYPEHGGTFGLFQPGGSGQGIGVIDVQWSQGTDEVAAYYTVSPTDVDPTWKQCNSGEPTATSTSESSAQDGIRCTLVDQDRPGNVTGVAVVAMDTEGIPASLRPNSGDAHRVVGYSQQVGIVSVEGEALPAGAVNGCTSFLDVEVRDSASPPRPIAGVNVDVHAQGPDDNLAFNTEPDEQDDFDNTQSDDSNAPQNHATETGRNCANDSRDGTQGVHAVGGGFGDRKHIESTRQTDDDGKFVFRLWSSSQGSTRVTAWADTTDDDRFCGNEEDGNALVTWGAAGSTPPPEGPEPPPCPNPSPSGTPSGSPTATATATATPSATPTGTATQTPTQTPTGTPTGTPSQTPTGTPSQTPTGTSTTTPGTTPTTAPTGTGTAVEPAATEITLEASQSRKTFGKRFTLSGAVSSDNEACTAFADVRILRDVVGGSDDFVEFDETQTDANGTFTESYSADRSANYVAEVVETASCDASTSDAEPVLVRVRVSLRLSDGRVQPGDRVRLGVRTAPCPATARDRVLLFRAIEGQFGETGKKRTNGRCRATFTRRIRETRVFQARWPKQDPEFLAGKSRSKAVRVVD